MCCHCFFFWLPTIQLSLEGFVHKLQIKNTTETRNCHTLVYISLVFPPLLYLLLAPTPMGTVKPARSFRRFEPKLKVRTPKALKRQNSKGLDLGSAVNVRPTCLGVFPPWGFGEFVEKPTLPETNIAPENRPGPKRKLVFQPSIFRCENVSFRGGY